MQIIFISIDFLFDPYFGTQGPKTGDNAFLHVYITFYIILIFSHFRHLKKNEISLDVIKLIEFFYGYKF